MTAPDLPRVPLTMGERETFDRLTRPLRRRCWCGRPAARDVVDAVECAEHDNPPPRQVRTTRYDTRPTARLRALAHRVARSPFADDLRHATRAAFWPAVVVSGLVVGLALVYLTRDLYVTWHGVQDLTPGSPR